MQPLRQDPILDFEKWDLTCVHTDKAIDWLHRSSSRGAQTGHYEDDL